MQLPDHMLNCLPLPQTSVNIDAVLPMLPVVLWSTFHPPSQQLA